MSPAATSLVVVTLEQLGELVRGAVQAAFVEQREDAAPALLDRPGIARALGVSPSTVDRLRREGMPATWICSAPRFELARCLEWLRVRPQPSDPDA